METCECKTETFLLYVEMFHHSRKSIFIQLVYWYLLHEFVVIVYNIGIVALSRAGEALDGVKLFKMNENLILTSFPGSLLSFSYLIFHSFVTFSWTGLCV